MIIDRSVIDQFDPTASLSRQRASHRAALEDIAKAMLYPDLRPSYDTHDTLVRDLASAMLRQIRNGKLTLEGAAKAADVDIYEDVVV